MKKTLLILIVCLYAPFGFAKVVLDTYPYKLSQKEIDSYMEPCTQTIKSKFPPDFKKDYCTCTLNKLLKYYSPQQLSSAPQRANKTELEAMMKRTEQVGFECLKELLKIE